MLPRCQGVSFSEKLLPPGKQVSRSPSQTLPHMFQFHWADAATGTCSGYAASSRETGTGGRIRGHFADKLRIRTEPASPPRAGPCARAPLSPPAVPASFFSSRFLRPATSVAAVAAVAPFLLFLLPLWRLCLNMHTSCPDPHSSTLARRRRPAPSPVGEAGSLCWSWRGLGQTGTTGEGRDPGPGSNGQTIT